MNEREKAAQSSRNLQAQELAKANEHEHQYRMHSHIDGCHFFHTTYLCSCGDVMAKGHERNFNDEDDPYSRMFALDDCPRCQELLKGAKPRELV